MSTDDRPGQPQKAGSLRIDDKAEDLERVVAGYVDRLNAGEHVEPLEVVTEHPRDGEAILAQLETFLGAGPQSGEHEELGTLGDYTLRRQIGRGGMGVVYEAWENSMQRRVALKILPPGLAADKAALQRFVLEAQVAGDLHHPNVVPVYSMGVQERTPFFAMEYVEGETLAQLLERLDGAGPETETPFGLKDQTDYFAALACAFAEVADGLQHAHSKGIVHRDLKPSNLILETARAARNGEAVPKPRLQTKHAGDHRRRRLRILDFGLVRLEGQDTITLTGDVVGTPSYMSPEQVRIQHGRADHRTDIYSLGATLYEVLTGRPPFRGKSPADTMAQILEQEPMSPRKRNPRVPKDCETIVLKCLRKDRGDRYRTAEALAQDLRRFSRGDPVEARPQSRVERVARIAVRRRWHLLVAAVLLTLSLAALLLGLRAYGASRRLAEERYREAIHRALPKLYRMGSKVAAGITIPGFISDADRRLLGGNELHPAEEAYEELGRLLEELPERPEAYYYRARALVSLQRVDEALRELERAIANSPHFVPALHLKALLDKKFALRTTDLLPYRWKPGSWQAAWLRSRDAEETQDAEMTAAAHGAFLDLLQRQENEPYFGAKVEGHLSRGLALFQKGELRAAIRDFTIAHELLPDALEPSLLLAKAYLRDGDPEAADRFLRTWSRRAAVEREAALWITFAYLFFNERPALPESALAWAEKISDRRLRLRTSALCLLFLHRLDEAEEMVREVLRGDPNDARALLVLGFVLKNQVRDRRGMRRDEEAGEFLEVALACDRELPPDLAYYGRYLKAVALAEAGEYAQARACRAGAPAEAEVFYLAGQYEEAHQASTVAVRRERQNADRRCMLARILVAQGRYAEAERQLEQIIREKKPLFSTPFQHLGRALLGQGRLEDAVRVSRQGRDFPPRNNGCHENLGEALWRLGRLEEALTAVDLGVERVPDRPRLHFVRGRILESLGDMEGAAAASETLLRLDPAADEGCVGIRRLLEPSAPTVSVAPQ